MNVCLSTSKLEKPSSEAMSTVGVNLKNENTQAHKHC